LEKVEYYELSINCPTIDTYEILYYYSERF